MDPCESGQPTGCIPISECGWRMTVNKLMGWCVAGTVIGLAGPVQLLGQDPSGRWEVTFVQAVQIVGGGVADTTWATGELVLALDGDRLTGTWQGVGTWAVEGTFTNGRLRFWSTELEEGDARLRQIDRIDWEGVAEGERLEGVQWMTMRQGGPVTPRRLPWGARRRGGAPFRPLTPPAACPPGPP